MPQPLSIVHTFAADAYRSLADLAGEPSGNRVLVEGFIQAQTNGITLRLGDKTMPGATDGGIAIAAAGGLGVGPVKDRSAAWPLGSIWVRNTTAGSNAVLVVQGVVD